MEWISAKLIFTDTVSPCLCYEVKTRDIYQDMLEDGELFDTSIRIRTRPFFTKYSKQEGKSFNKMRHTSIQEFVGLRPKMYSILKG